MSSRRSRQQSGSTRISDNHIIELVSKLRQLVPEIRDRCSNKVAVTTSMEPAQNEQIKAQANVVIDEEGNVSNTSNELDGNHEKNEGRVDNKKGWLLCMVVLALSLLSFASLYLIIKKFRVAKVDISLSEESGKENEGWLLGMVAQACWLLGTAIMRLIKATKIGINYGVFKFEIPLRALWGDGV